MNLKFETLKLKDELTENLKDLNFDSMTPIQAKSLPLILKGDDIIAQAKTGSGKTAAFSLGIINALDVENLKHQALVLCPTRELAEQVAKEIRTLARKIQNIKVLTITGGQAEYHQDKSLGYGAHIIVATPGRVLRLLDKKTLSLDSINTLVLDEADRMLDMGFREDILKISEFTPKHRQTLLFSATFTDVIKELGSAIQQDAISVEVDTDHIKETIEEKFFELASHKDKPDALIKILNHYRPKRFIVFCKTKQICDDVAKKLDKKNIWTEAIHGDLEQKDRTAVLTMFSNRSLSALIATDVAARGLDIESLELVINYDLPSTAETYVHRVGRTGRAGEKGMAVSLLMSRELSKLESISQVQNKVHATSSIEELSHNKEYDQVPPMVTIYISGGRKDKLRPGDIVGAIVGEAKVDADVIGDISIMNINTFVAIKRESVDHVIEKLNNGKIKKRKFRVGLL